MGSEEEKYRAVTLKPSVTFIRTLCTFDICFLHADMRRDVQEIFKMTPHEKQVMMFSATLSKEIRPVCRKFMQDVSLMNIKASACQCAL